MLKRYKCHKTVLAAEITGINADGSTIYFASEDQIGECPTPPQSLPNGLGYQPVLGDYLVEYVDGYRAISPKKAFEDGYNQEEEALHEKQKTTEEQIQEKGLTAPRITPDHIHATVKQETFFRVPETTMTVCFLMLKNGTIVTGESACVSPENFDAKIGADIARDNAIKKIWDLEGYLLAEKLNGEKVIDVEVIAQVCHEVNKAYCEALGDNTQVSWEDAPEWQRESAIVGVNLHLNVPEAGPETSHNSWMAQKKADEWVYGEKKDPENKTHPCLVPFSELPVDQQAKDFIFRQVVHSLANGL